MQNETKAKCEKSQKYLHKVDFFIFKELKMKYFFPFMHSQGNKESSLSADSKLNSE